MTGEEKRRQLKEKYKEDLRLRKEFLNKAKELKRSKKMNDAITEITSSLDMEDTDQWIETLNREAAVSEAKMEMSLDDEDLPTLEKKVDEAANKKFAAEDLVRKMKIEMGLEVEPEKPTEAPAEEEETPAKPTSEKEPDEEKKDPPPSKKLGDF